MQLSTLDIALRGATVALCWCWPHRCFAVSERCSPDGWPPPLLWGRRRMPLTYSIGTTSPVSIAHAPLIALSTGNVVVFWLFTRALFDETFKLRWWHALIWAAVAAFSFVNCMWIAPASGARLSIVAINMIALGFIALAVTQTVASWSADLVERRRRVRVFIVGPRRSMAA